jgi:hypothetical protein
VIAWVDYRNGRSDIYYQRYNSSGVAQGSNVKVNDDTLTVYQWAPSISMDRSGNFVIAWEDFRNGNYDIYCQKYNSLGVAQGVNVKVNDDTLTAYQWAPSISMDKSGNFVIAWQDYRNVNSDIYYQRYNSLGIAQGSNAKVNDDTVKVEQGSPSVSMNESGNFVIAWVDYRNGYSDIYYQRYNSLGVAQGSNVKVNDDTGGAKQWNPVISMDRSGNFVIIWKDYRYGKDNPDIIGQRYYSDGSTRGANYRIVADGPNWAEVAPQVIANASQIVFTWQDNRRSKGWDIYAKIVTWDWDGVTGVKSDKLNKKPETFELFQNYPNPFNSETKIKFYLPKDSEVKIKIYDILGREIVTLLKERRKMGYYTIVWNSKNKFGKDVASGVYIYHIQAGKYSTTKKMTLLR